MSTLILRTAAKLLVPLSLTFAVFVYFKGHQMPGGGFVAGLVTAVALVVHRMSMGPGSLQKLLPASERTIIAIGLALALGTGMAALLFGLPFLASNYGYWPLPDGDYVEWATVMAFDLGVMLVVAGVVVGMIDALSREME
jgi:multisubunit Na+/H+ antiporter MnhB subunit